MASLPRRFAFAIALAAARGAAAGDDVPPEAVIATLPFVETSEPNRIIVDVAPEGSPPLRLMLDTGAAHSVLTPLAARAAGISVRKTKSTPYRRATRLGRDLQFDVDTRRSDTGSATGWEYGLLGGEFLAQFVVELDFEARVVRFLDPDAYRVPEAADAPDETVMPIRVGGLRPVVTIAIGERPVSVIFDTGSHLTAIISGNAARKLGIDPDLLPPYRVAHTVVGPMPLRLYAAPSFSVGPFGFGRAPVLVAPAGWYGLAGETDDSVIGCEAISRFRVRIDYPHGRLWLRRTTTSLTLGGEPWEPADDATAPEPREE